jgi:hypothetical protein
MSCLQLSVTVREHRGYDASGAGAGAAVIAPIVGCAGDMVESAGMVGAVGAAVGDGIVGSA